MYRLSVRVYSGRDSWSHTFSAMTRDEVIAQVEAYIRDNGYAVDDLAVPNFGTIWAPGVTLTLPPALIQTA